jgi:uncharacterized membrane protein
VLIYAFLSALFALLTAIFAKLGLANLNATLAMGVQMVVVLVITEMAIGKAIQRSFSKCFTYASLLLEKRKLT